jgi:pimeloyl-ACP methyl ester carboxylesterase
VRFSALDMWLLGRAAERPYYPAGTDVINRLQPVSLHDITDGNDYGYVAEWNDCWSVHILGSDDARDWVENIFGWVRKTETGSVIGYGRPAERIAEQIADVIDHRPVFGEGHSRGGAIVADVCLRLAQVGADIRRVITFGSPPTGGREWWNNMADEALLMDRHIINGDIVPGTPPWGMQYGRPIRYARPNCLLRIARNHLDYGRVLTTEEIYNG